MFVNVSLNLYYVDNEDPYQTPRCAVSDLDLTVVYIEDLT